MSLDSWTESGRTNCLRKQCSINDCPLLSRQRTLRISFAGVLLESDASQVSNLKDALLAAEVEQVPVLCEYLARHGTGLADELWSAASQSTSDSEQGPRLLRAASVANSENDGDWATVSSAVADAVLQENRCTWQPGVICYDRCDTG